MISRDIPSSFLILYRRSLRLGGRSADPSGSTAIPSSSAVTVNLTPFRCWERTTSFAAATGGAQVRSMSTDRKSAISLQRSAASIGSEASFMRAILVFFRASMSIMVEMRMAFALFPSTMRMALSAAMLLISCSSTSDISSSPEMNAMVPYLIISPI